MSFHLSYVQKTRSLLLVVGLALLSPLGAQPVTVRGSVGKAITLADSTKIVVYARPSGNLNNVLFENVNLCISIPDQGIANPQVYVHQNFMPTLDWIPAGGNPDVINGRAYYTFIGNDNDSGTTVSWSAANDNPVITLSFKQGTGRAHVQLNDISEGGIGFGGGSSRQSFWYVQVNTLGDITDYDQKFYQSLHSQAPLNGGEITPSSVETTDEIALPVSVSPENLVWQIFPNPATGPLYLIAGKSGDAWVRLFDQAGRLVWEQQINLFQEEVNPLYPGVLSPGAYLLELRDTGGQRLFAERVIVLRE
jgi:hypothetical protein